MTVLRTLQQTGIWFSEQCCEIHFTGWGAVQLNGLLQTLHSCGGRAQEHNSTTVPEPRRLLSSLLCLYVTLASENFHSAWGAAILFELLPSGRGELLFPCGDFWCGWELRWAAEGSALLAAVLSVLETVQREENLLSLCRSFFGSSGKILPLPEQHLKSIFPGQKCKDGNSCLNLTHFLWVPYPWYVLFHALMWNLLVTDADGCRIKCTFLWLCQVDMLSVLS